MAYPIVVAYVQSSTSATKNHSFAVPAGVEAGDLLVCAVSAYDAAAASPPFTAPSGWTAPANNTVGTDFTYALFIKQAATGAETTVPFTSLHTVSCSIVCYIVRGHDPAVAPVVGGGASVDAPALTAPWGAAENLWLLNTFSTPGNANVNKFPAGYAMFKSYGFGGSTGQRTSTFKRNLYAATDDPGNVGFDAAVTARTRAMVVKPLPPTPIDAAFDWSATGEPLTVQFIDMSSGGPPVTWSWTFGDGGTSTIQDPRHTYATAGTYTVTLVASNGAVTDTYSEAITIVAPSGRPELGVVVGDQDLTCFLTTARWTTGREGWLQPIEPAMAQLTFNEDVPAEIGDRIYLSCQYGLIWTGYVTEVNVEQTPDGRYLSTVSGTDVLGLFGQSDIVKVTLPAGDIIAKMNYLATLDSRTLTMQTGQSADMTWPSLAAQTSFEGNALQAMQIYEDSSNAVLVCHPRDVVVAQKRIQLPDPITYLPLELAGADCPSSWSKQRATTRVLNDYQFTDTAGAVIGSFLYTESVAKYGRRTFSAPVLVTSVPQLPWMDVAAEPRYVVPEARFHVSDGAQQVQLLQPLDFVTFAGEDWQVMRVQHDVLPGSWDMIVSVDVTQNAFVGEPEQPPDTPPPPGQTIVHEEHDSDKDAYVLLHSNGNKMGAGMDSWLPVGYWQGSKYRSLVAFNNFSSPAGTIGVKKATLTLKTSTQAKVGFGSSPKFKVQAIDQNWTAGGATSPSTGNAVRWPGPTAVTGNQVTRSVTRNQNTVITIDVTGIVKMMWDRTDLSLGRGFRLISTNEGSSGPTTEFYSAQGSSTKPRLAVDWIVVT